MTWIDTVARLNDRTRLEVDRAAEAVAKSFRRSLDQQQERSVADRRRRLRHEAIRTAVRSQLQSRHQLERQQQSRSSNEARSEDGQRLKETHRRAKGHESRTRFDTSADRGDQGASWARDSPANPGKRALSQALDVPRDHHASDGTAADEETPSRDHEAAASESQPERTGSDERRSRARAEVSRSRPGTESGSSDHPEAEGESEARDVSDVLSPELLGEAVQTVENQAAKEADTAPIEENESSVLEEPMPESDGQEDPGEWSSLEGSPSREVAGQELAGALAAALPRQQAQRRVHLESGSRAESTREGGRRSDGSGDLESAPDAAGPGEATLTWPEQNAQRVAAIFLGQGGAGNSGVSDTAQSAEAGASGSPLAAAETIKKLTRECVKAIHVHLSTVRPRIDLVLDLGRLGQVRARVERRKKNPRDGGGSPTHPSREFVESVDNGAGVSVHFETSSPEATLHLQRALPELDQRLRDQKVDVVDLTVA